MKRFLFGVVLAIGFKAFTFAQSSLALWDDARISKVYVTLSADSLQELLSDPLGEHYFISTFVFDDGQNRDTVTQAGIRLRGNTSRFAAKKSFKISFNEYLPGRRYQGTKKLNLIGMHNDPTLIRQKLFYDIWNKSGLPNRRGTFVEFYLNGVYRGLYTNIEELDNDWLTRVFGENDGNFYKCTYPANLGYLGSNPATYQNLVDGNGRHVYELQTNENNPDYSDLAQLITTLNGNPDANFITQIQAQIDVSGFLKAFALDVATGNWDDYAYNQNNYYLYHHLGTGKFEFITYDADNTFGVDWIGRDWATRDCDDWVNRGSPRPLASKLLDVPAFRQLYYQHLDSITRYLTCPDSIFPHIAQLKQLITGSVVSDTFRTLDYGYTMYHFNLGFTGTVDGHTPYGIQPFLSTRCSSTTSQLGPLLSEIESQVDPIQEISCSPNPSLSSQSILLRSALAPQINWEYQVLDMQGRQIISGNWVAGQKAIQIQSPAVRGLYMLKITSPRQSSTLKWVVE